MTIILGIITSIVMFSIIVLLHEYGHFKTARMFGVKIYEFGLGMPPRAKKVKTDKFGTEYTINWLPLGGFVRLKGENVATYLIFDKNKKLVKSAQLESKILSGEKLFDKNSNEISKEELDLILEKIKENYAPDSLISKAWYKQSIVILAGVFMNFMLAWVVLSILFFIGVKPLGINSKIQTNLDLKLIPNVEKALNIGLLDKKSGISFASSSGSILDVEDGVLLEIKSKDKNYKINEYNELVSTLQENIGNKITVSGYVINENCFKEKNCESNNFTKNVVVPQNGKLGIYIGENIQLNSNFEYKYSFFKSIKYAGIETKNQSLLTLESLKYLLEKIISPKTPTDRQEAINDMSGPIGIVTFITQSMNYGVKFVILVGVIISINLGVFNLLPIPALDGGRFLLLSLNTLVKKIFKVKVISDSVESFIHVAFFALLIVLSFFIAYNDISKLIN